jgi:hypothetical protein
MVHQLTAAVLLVLMTLVTATSQHGLNYCACLEEVLVGNCECPVETKEATESCCSHLDHSETCDDHGSGGNHKFECDSRDCLVSLYFETDDFQNSIQEFRVSPEKSGDASSSLSDHSFALSAVTPCKANEKRGPPGTEPLPASVPLFARHSVFLL